MNLTAFAIKKNRISLSLLFIVVLLGIALYQDLPRDSMPPYVVRVATIVSVFPGANPERVELLVSKNIEEVVQEIPEVKTITSQSRTGLSVVTVELKDEVSKEMLQDVWDELRRKLEDMTTLPSGVAPNLNDDDVGVVYGIILGLISTDFSYAEMEDVAERIRDELIALPDSAKVELGGIQEQQVVVEFDTARLSEYGLTVQKLGQIIKETNILDSGGEINVGEKRLILEPTGNYDTIQDLKKTIIPVGDKGETVFLESITTIRKTYKTPPTSLVRVNGKPAISIAISLKDQANIISLGKMVEECIADLNRRLPLGFEVIRLASLDGYVQESIDSFIGNLFSEHRHCHGGHAGVFGISHGACGSRAYPPCHHHDPDAHGCDPHGAQPGDPGCPDHGPWHDGGQRYCGVGILYREDGSRQRPDGRGPGNLQGADGPAAHFNFDHICGLSLLFPGRIHHG